VKNRPATGIFRFVLATSFLSAAIGASAVYAQFEAGSYRPANPGKLTQAPPRNTSADSTYSIGPIPLYRPTLAPGDGVQDVEVYCSTCHSTVYITMQPPLPADTWNAEVTKMQKAFGAKIPDDASQEILRYLQSHYTPETRKPSESEK
jgi:hypothetical protein